MIESPTNILIVDDDPGVAEVVAAQLERAGFLTRCVYSGEEALRVLRESEFDVVLLDYSMPGMNGVEVLREIKGSHPRTSVIMVSGAPPPEVVAEALRLGALEYLFKPVKFAELERALARAIGRGSRP
ncbi:MAG: response regulator [Planctomycetota bacterium]|nr:response regulator [Planctomycetota bacterium]